MTPMRSRSWSVAATTARSTDTTSTTGALMSGETNASTPSTDSSSLSVTDVGLTGFHGLSPAAFCAR
ncbi:Uncharacterised protein [Mycobacteroides abscessus subsp. abscessus]|nr:Uncharacterised protein [Mycobacteroides abscessus subsp. abscessus]